jgi:hypothetical protein
MPKTGGIQGAARFRQRANKRKKQGMEQDRAGVYRFSYRNFGDLGVVLF